MVVVVMLVAVMVVVVMVVAVMVVVVMVVVVVIIVAVMVVVKGGCIGDDSMDNVDGGGCCCGEDSDDLIGALSGCVRLHDTRSVCSKAHTCIHTYTQKPMCIHTYTPHPSPRRVCRKRKSSPSCVHTTLSTECRHAPMTGYTKESISLQY